MASRRLSGVVLGCVYKSARRLSHAVQSNQVRRRRHETIYHNWIVDARKRRLERPPFGSVKAEPGVHNMLTRRHFIIVSSGSFATATIAATAEALAQDYPSRPVTMVVQFPAGYDLEL
jgi:hypothetical protein